MTETRLYTGNTPTVSVAGAVRGELTRDLLRLEVEEGSEGLRTLLLRLHALPPGSGKSAIDPTYLDGAVVDFGSAVSVDFGPPGRSRQIFEGTVSAIELSLSDGDTPYVSVYAEDVLMALRMTRRSRSYENSSDADVAVRIGRDHGLRTQVDAPGPSYPVIQQWNQSDLAFLRDRAARIQAEVWARGSTLHFAARTGRSAGEVALVHGNELLSAHIRADLAHQRSAVVVTGFDLDTKERIQEEAGPAVLQREVTGGRTGPQVLVEALGERRSVRSREVPTTAEQARSWAEAEMLRRGRAFVSVEGTTAGTPELQVGTLVRLERAGAAFSGPGYYTTWVQHSFDPATGSRTRFRAERATVS